MVLIVRKLVSAILSLGLVLSLCAEARGENAPGVSAESALVMHAGGQVIYEKNADRRALIASTTKIMTAIVSLENLELEEQVKIMPEACGVEGSSMYLEPGQSYTVRELLCGLLLVSGNDAALALAIHTAGSVESFTRLMNRKAKELGMSGSRFMNPHGLNADGHYSTARDMARLMAHCMENADFASIISLPSCSVGDQTLVNHNRLLGLCPGCIGGKTGYTQAAGRCLVSCCQRDGTRYICVTLNAPDDWNDHVRLYDWAFSAYSQRDVSAGVSFEIPLVSGTKDVALIAPEPLFLFLPKSAELRLEAEMPWFAFAPVEAGEPAGKLSVYCGDDMLAEVPLSYQENIAAATKTNNSDKNAMEHS